MCETKSDETKGINRYRRYQKPYLKRLKKRLLKRYGGKCVVCGATTGLEFAHVKPTGLNGRGRGQSKRLLDVLKNPNCYTLTCKQHNGEVEHVRDRDNK